MSTAVHTKGSSRIATRLSARGTSWLVLAGALVLTLPGSWVPSLWTDEAATISAARRPVDELWALVHHLDAVHGAYYLLMHGWLTLTTPTPFLLRLPSALMVSITCVVVFRLALRWLRPPHALLAAAVFALLPRVSWMAIEARSSAASTMLAALTTMALVVWVERSRPRWLIGYAVGAGAMITMNVFTAFLLPAHAVSVLLLTPRWRLRLAWLVAALVGCLLAIPVLVLASGQSGQLGDPQLSVLSWVRNVVVDQWFLGETPTPSVSAQTVPPALAWKGGAVALALASWTLIALALWRRRAERSFIAWLLPWLVVPTLLVSALIALDPSAYNARYLAFCAPAVALLVTAGLVALRPRLMLAVALLLLVSATPVYISQRGEHAKAGADWEQVVAYIDANKRPGDGVYFVPRYPIEGPVVGRTSRGAEDAYPAPFEGLVDITQERSPEETDDLVGTSRLLSASTDRLAQVQRVWMIARKDYAYRAEDVATLRRAGFREAEEWSSVQDRVTGFTRS